MNKFDHDLNTFFALIFHEISLSGVPRGQFSYRCVELGYANIWSYGVLDKLLKPKPQRMLLLTYA